MLKENVIFRSDAKLAENVNIQIKYIMHLYTVGETNGQQTLVANSDQ